VTLALRFLTATRCHSSGAVEEVAVELLGERGEYRGLYEEVRRCNYKLWTIGDTGGYLYSTTPEMSDDQL
jgi:hypothetical protein